MHFIIFSATNLAFRFSLVILLAWGLLLGEGISQESTSKGGELNPLMKQDIKAFQQALIQDEVTGSNIVIVSGADGVIYESIVNSGKDGDRDVTNETLFPLWSMTKPVTIVAMLTLHEKQLFDWKDPVAKYIPCFENLMVQE